MTKKYVCPDCKKQEVEAVNACGASSYFCNNCKKLISRSRIEEQKNDVESKDKA